MAIAFYMDENVSGKDIVDELREQGVDVITVQEDGLAGASDPDIYAHPRRVPAGVCVRDLRLMAEVLYPQDFEDRKIERLPL